MNDVKRYEIKQPFIQTGQIRVYKKAELVESEAGGLVSISDHQALQAENERLKVLLARHNDGVLRLIGLSDKRERVRVGENMREETPEMMQPVINKLKADAVREACEIAASCLSRTDTAEMMHDAIISYADSLDSTKLEAGE